MIYQWFFLILIIHPLALHSQVRLPKLISDGMVLQRDTDINIWGWAAKNEEIEIRFMGSFYYTKANENGEWKLVLSGLKPGGPYKMNIIATNNITIKDVYIGEVWVCSGQSQMDINMERVSPLYQEEIKNAGNPNIRYFSVPTAFVFGEPQKDLPSGKWESISKDNILKVSAIAYFFAVEMYNKYKVPIGMIRSSLGGSPAQAWISKDAIRSFPEYYKEAVNFENDKLIQKIREADSERIRGWYSELYRTDAGYKDADMPWYKAEVDRTGWSTIHVPGYWDDSDLGMINGAVWFRKDLILPDEYSGKPARLNLGCIVDADSVFVNGTFVGTTGYQYPPRRYNVPENILVSGKNTVVVRVISNIGRAGFVPDKPYELVIGSKSFDLAGDWKYKLGAVMKPLEAKTFVRWKPTGLYNGMISPLTKYTIKGVLWYQGESNTNKPKEYGELFPTMITNWRENWNQGDFPFIFVQLHNFMKSYDHPTESNWARTRESQMKALKLPNTAMAVAIDLGEWNDIHPLNKKDVAIRLSLAAQKTAYGEKDISGSGPIYQSMKIHGERIVISFSDAGSELIVKGGGELNRFEIAGEDRKFVWADAKIVDNKVVVSNKQIKNPVAVRYAWADNPEGANLYNKEGLPASPFRTDNW
jgi:sialate O-acetylesterase